MREDAAVALARLGWGPRFGEAPPDDPHAWARAQLAAPDPYDGAGLPDTEQSLAIVAEVAAAGPGGMEGQHPVQDALVGAARA